MALSPTSSRGGGGASLPSEWTIDDAGNLKITPGEDQTLLGTLSLVASDANYNVLEILNKAGSTRGDWDNTGFISCRGASVSTNDDEVIFTCTRSAGGSTRDLATFTGEGGPRVKITKDGQIAF